MSNNELVECKICGQKMKKINHLHLRKHGLTSKEYLRMYPDAKLSIKKSDKIDEVEKMDNDFNFEEIEVNEKVPDSEFQELENNHFEKQFNEKFRRSLVQQNQKRNVLRYLFFHFPDVEVNYQVEIFNLHGNLINKFITDFAMPKRKVAIFCPDVFWHNEDQPRNPNKYSKLREYGWKVIIANGTDIFKEIKNIDLD